MSSGSSKAAGNEKLSRVIIVGAGFGELAAARALRDSPLKVFSIDYNYLVLATGASICVSAPWLWTRFMPRRGSPFILGAGRKSPLLD